jgi:DNA repair protein RadC
MNADYTGHRQRVKKKYKAAGFNGWLDYEILEFALFYAIPRKDTKSLARELLKRFKTIKGVLDADKREIEKIGGVSKHVSAFLDFLKDITVHYLEEGLYKRDVLSSPDLIFNYLKASTAGNNDEEFKAVFLNSRNRLLAIETIHKGTVNKSAVYPRKIVERALYNHAVGVIVAHNHPGGGLKPSADDYKVTRVIGEALKTVDVSLLDHIIIGGGGYFSFRENSEI